MDKFKLNSLLDKSIQLFADETQLLFNGKDSDSPATKNDLFELSQRITYVLSEIKKIIVENAK